MTKAVIFDAFEVIFLNASGYFFDKYVGDESKRGEFTAVNQASDRNELNYEQRIHGLAKAVDMPYEFVNSMLYKDLVRNDQLLTLIRNIKSKYKIGLLSNTGPGSIEQFMSEAELNSLFDTVVLSYETEYTKPSPEIFQLTAARLDVLPEECVFVDDSLKNCEGAEATGMKSIQYENYKDFELRFNKVIS